MERVAFNGILNIKNKTDETVKIKLIKQCKTKSEARFMRRIFVDTIQKIDNSISCLIIYCLNCNSTYKRSLIQYK